jgi:hypothetical protein
MTICDFRKQPARHANLCKFFGRLVADNDSRESGAVIKERALDCFWDQ